MKQNKIMMYKVISIEGPETLLSYDDLIEGLNSQFYDAEEPEVADNIKKLLKEVEDNKKLYDSETEPCCKKYECKTYDYVYGYKIIEVLITHKFIEINSKNEDIIILDKHNIVYIDNEGNAYRVCYDEILDFYDYKPF